MVLDGQVVPASPVEEMVEAGPEQLGIGAITNNRLISDPWLASESFKRFQDDCDDLCECVTNR